MSLQPRKWIYRGSEITKKHFYETFWYMCFQKQELSFNKSYASLCRWLILCWSGRAVTESRHKQGSSKPCTGSNGKVKSQKQQHNLGSTRRMQYLYANIGTTTTRWRWRWRCWLTTSLLLLKYPPTRMGIHVTKKINRISTHYSK